MTPVFAEFLRYEPESGKFFWVKSPSSKAPVGSEAGALNSGGYRQIKLRGARYYAHRLAWWFVNGVEPRDELDHVNGSPDDNRIANLRECGRCENMQNRPAVGAWLDKRRGVWYADVQAFGVRERLGPFKTEAAARSAFAAAREIRQPVCVRVSA